MTLSVGMNNALVSLLSINDQMTTTQTSLQTGKRFNSASDGAVQWLQISDFSNKSSSLNKINDALTVALSQTKSASTALTSIRSKLVSTQNTLNDVYSTQQAVIGSSATTDTVTQKGSVFKLTLSADPNGPSTTINKDSLIDGAVMVNGLRLNANDEFKLKVNTGDITAGGTSNEIKIKIVASTAEAQETTVANKNIVQGQLNAANAQQAINITNQTNAANAVAVTGTAAANISTLFNSGLTGIATGLNANVFNYNLMTKIANALQLPTLQSMTAQQYIDGLNSVKSSGSVNGTAFTTAEQTAAGNAITAAATQISATNATTKAAAQYSVALTAKATADATVNTGQLAITDLTNQLNSINANLQDGVNNAFLVATVEDYLNVLQKVNTQNDQNKLSFNNGVPGAGNNQTSFTFKGTSNGVLSVTRTGTGNPDQVADLRTIFQSFYNPVDSSTDTTKAYNETYWTQNGSTFSLINKEHTGSTPGTVTVAADSKRKLAANNFRQMLTDINQIVKDTSVNGLNLLTGGKLSVAINTEGDDFVFQFTNDDGSTAKYNGAGLGINLEAAKVSLVAGQTNNNFSNNTDLDTALAQLTAAISKIDVASGLIGDAQTSLNDRTSFNKSMANLFNATSTSLNAVDTTQASAELASLQTRQQFATSIMSIIKQTDQNPLMLLR